MKLLDHIEIPYEDTDRDYTTTCLWCGAEKLSVSKQEGHVFQCWRCKETGNAITIMRKWYADLPELTIQDAKRYVSRKRGVSPAVLRAEGVRYDCGYFWFPVRNVKGDIIALHKYNPSDNIAYASPKPWNCSILGLDKLHGNDELWIAEGHADYLIMRHVLSRSPGVKIDLLGTCGSSFSSSYLHLLEKKSVVLLFDNDEAGRSGVQSVARRIKTSGHVVESLQYLDWSTVTVPEFSVIPDKFDIRDLYNAYSL